MRRHVLTGVAAIVLCVCMFGCRSDNTPTSGDAAGKSTELSKESGTTGTAQGGVTASRPPGSTDPQFGTKAPK